jgi:hypothetical protein
MLAVGVTLSAGAQDRSVDADRLPVDVERIARLLAIEADAEKGTGLKLEYYLSVYGEAPTIRLFSPDEDLMRGPVKHSSPSHLEFMEFWTPQVYRTPGFDFSAIRDWLTDRLKGRD